MKIRIFKTSFNLPTCLTTLIIILAILINICSTAYAQNNNFSWKETDTSIALYDLDKIVWKYNFKTEKGKPFFHPINIGDTRLTALSPEDHPWHLGFWFSWKYINGINYWEYDNHRYSPEDNIYGITEINAVTIEKFEFFHPPPTPGT